MNAEMNRWMLIKWIKQCWNERLNKCRNKKRMNAGINELMNEWMNLEMNRWMLIKRRK